jgi:hypothetical protein
VCHKTAYSLRQARDALVRVQKRRKRRPEKRYYFCPDCGAYHLTSQSKWLDKPKRRTQLWKS